MDLDSVLLIGPGSGIDASHPVHSKFDKRETLFEIYGRVTLEEVIILSNEIMAKTDANGLIDIQKIKCLYKRLFNSSDNELQNHLSVNTSTTLRSGLITLKLLIDHVTAADRESVRNAEKDLHDLHLKDYDFDVSKVITKIRTIVKTLQANGVLTNTLISDCIIALHDNECCKDYRLDVKLFEKDYNRGNSIEVNSMLTSLEKKYTSLKKSNKWTCPKKSSVDAKYMALLASGASEDDKLKGLF